MIRNPLIILLVFCLAVACARPQFPEIQEISHLNLNRGQNKELLLDIGLSVHNPNKFKIALVTYELDVFVNGNEIGHTSSEGKLILNKLSTDDLRFQVESSIQKMLGSALGLLGALFSENKEMKLRVKGTATARAKGFQKKFLVDEEKPFQLKL